MASVSGAHATCGDGTAAFRVKAGGENLPTPTPVMPPDRFFAQEPSVLVQLFNSDTPICWESEFSDAKKNLGDDFRASVKQ